jgi:transcriptional regulator with XRE-family HTH domain
MSENGSRVSMKVNAELIVRLRRERSWSQDELAGASGLNLRTIQRVETHGSASLQTKKALAAAFDLDARDLDGEEMRMKPCPVCGSNEIYQYDQDFGDPSAPGGATLLPGLGGILSPAKLRPSVCHGCGYVRIFASAEARKKLKTAKHWKPVGT